MGLFENRVSPNLIVYPSMSLLFHGYLWHTPFSDTPFYIICWLHMPLTMNQQMIRLPWYCGYKKALFFSSVGYTRHFISSVGGKLTKLTICRCINRLVSPPQMAGFKSPFLLQEGDFECRGPSFQLFYLSRAYIYIYIYIYTYVCIELYRYL